MSVSIDFLSLSLSSLIPSTLPFLSILPTPSPSPPSLLSSSSISTKIKMYKPNYSIHEKSMCVICFESLANNSNNNNDRSNNSNSNNQNNHSRNNMNSLKPSKRTDSISHSERECSSELLIELPCSHLFHSSCIRDWIGANQRHPSCPLCRSTFAIRNDEQPHYNHSQPLPHITIQNNNISNNNNGNNSNNYSSRQTIQTGGNDDWNDPRCHRLLPSSSTPDREQRMEIDSIGEDGLNEHEMMAADDDIPPPPLLTRSDGYYLSDTSLSTQSSPSPFPSPALSSLLTQRGFVPKP